MWRKGAGDLGRQSTGKWMGVFSRAGGAQEAVCARDRLSSPTPRLASAAELAARPWELGRRLPGDSWPCLPLSGRGWQGGAGSLGLLHFPVTQLPQLLASQAVNGPCDQEQYMQLWWQMLTLPAQGLLTGRLPRVGGISQIDLGTLELVSL